MSNLAHNLVAATPLPAKKLPTPHTRQVIDNLTPAKRREIMAFQVVLEYVLSLPTDKDTQAQKIAEFERQFISGNLPDAVVSALVVVRKKKASVCPDKATLYRWLTNFDKYQGGHAHALTKQYHGRPRTLYGWEHKAIELFNLPSKPEYATVAFWLRTDHGYASATKERVTRYLQSMPATLGKQSPQRMGKTFYKHNLAPHKIRDNEDLPVGFGYEGDGHRVDVYVAHPSTGHLYRPELTIWIDIRSRLVVGWYLADDEAAISTLFGLSEAILSHDHVPAMLFMDNGSGFASRMMTDEVTGFFSRLSITTSFCLPGNSKGKGLVEGFNRLFRDRHDKKFITYCGDDMAPEINRRLSSELESGKRTLPSMAEYTASVRQFIIDYNNEPKPVLDKQTPLTVWTAGLQQVRVHIHADALVQPREFRTVRQFRIRLDNRQYQAAELAQYNGEEVLVEYSLHHDEEVRVLDKQERLICVAKLVSKIARLPASRIKEAQQKRTDGAVKRLQNKIHEKQQRGQPVLSIEDSTNALIELTDFRRVEDHAATTDFDPLDYLDIPAAKTLEADTNSSYLDWLDD